ncbi:hypothetical protein AUJ30_00070 [Candidatus Wolfebacteria bacterium CG1_02_39_135]|uniref:Uncharacterized protein n=1 Tax=Candidatus Wolfebacteria bacterium CG1_02_39_135 TaxID=1805425 RepID=A0A1J4XY26_9BACT|nr:MAG: hypothetical protein AUJ30_00070 [Candidatus Wolfebacteria bacterium CG1_02_39_135]
MPKFQRISLHLRIGLPVRTNYPSFAQKRFFCLSEFVFVEPNCFYFPDILTGKQRFQDRRSSIFPVSRQLLIFFLSDFEQKIPMTGFFQFFLFPVRRLCFSPSHRAKKLFEYIYLFVLLILPRGHIFENILFFVLCNGNNYVLFEFQR